MPWDAERRASRATYGTLKDADRRGRCGYVCGVDGGGWERYVLGRMWMETCTVGHWCSLTRHVHVRICWYCTGSVWRRVDRPLVDPCGCTTLSFGAQALSGTRYYRYVRTNCLNALTRSPAIRWRPHGMSRCPVPSSR